MTASTTPLPEYTLSNGQKMPAVGLGIPSTPDEVEKGVEEALKAGYRHFDTAWLYNNEDQIGRVLKRLEKDYPRESFFITSKLWNIFHQPDQVKPALLESLKDLQTSYVDLYLMHWPIALVKDEEGPASREYLKKRKIDLTVSLEDTWAAMEELVDQGLVRAIGVSNFSVTHLKRILRVARHKPVVNQIEVHPYLPQHELIQFCKDNDILVTAYAPLGRGRELVEDPTIQAIANEHDITPGQVVLSWGVQRGTVVIPKSANPQRLRDNITIVKLSEDNMNVLDKLSKTSKTLRVYDPGNSLGVQIF